MIRLTRVLGIDLGTANTSVSVRGKGVVLSEPSIVAVHESRGMEVVGNAAQCLLDKDPDGSTLHFPMRDSVIADYAVAVKLLRPLIRRACGRWQLLKPAAVVCVPSGINTVEQLSVLQACREAGVAKIATIHEPLAAAVGLNMPTGEPSAHIVVDIGAGTTNIVAVSLDRVVLDSSISVGGEALSDSLLRTLRAEHNMIVSDYTVRKIKHEIGSAAPLDPEVSMIVHGRDLQEGFPRVLRLTSEEIRSAIAEPIARSVNWIRSTFQHASAELMSEAMINGVTLTGGGALLQGMDRLLHLETGLPFRVADDPIHCAAIGASKAFDRPNLLQY